jgi:hypothetical protein
VKLIIFLLLIVAGAWYWLSREPPGTGPDARTGMTRSAPLIAAIERYNDAHGQYPTSLEDLVPDFLPLIPNTIVGGHPPTYERTDRGYAFTFSYTTPLPVYCSYRPGVKWKCRYLGWN